MYRKVYMQVSNHMLPECLLITLFCKKNVLLLLQPLFPLQKELPQYTNIFMQIVFQKVIILPTRVSYMNMGSEDLHTK